MVNPLLILTKVGVYLEKILDLQLTVRLLLTLSLTFGTRQHKTLYLEHIPIQNDSVKLPRGSGQALPGSPGNQKKRKVRETRCCYWKLETSAEGRRGSFNHLVNPSGSKA